MDHEVRFGDVDALEDAVEEKPEVNADGVLELRGEVNGVVGESQLEGL